MSRKFRKHAAIAASLLQSGITDPAFLEPLGAEHYPEFEARLGYTFKEPKLLARALTHRSAPEAAAEGDYERLEFLGDAVLELAVAHLLTEKHCNASEGVLSKMRASLVSEGSLATIARRLELGRFVRLSWVELSNGASDRASVLADVVEAVLGAVYLESGFEVVREIIARLFGDGVISVTMSDPKTDLQELFHARKQGNPTYILEATEGPEHAPVFVSAVEVNGEILGRGRGKTKKVSQQAAALEALNRLMAEAQSKQAQNSSDEISTDLDSGESQVGDTNDNQQ
jgi:ribonuclease-3